jgi:hypothetical protein
MIQLRHRRVHRVARHLARVYDVAVDDGEVVIEI